MLKNKYRILAINDHYPPNAKGGYEQRCKDAVKWFQRKGYDICVITTKSDHDPELPENVFPLFYSYLDESVKNESSFREFFRMFRENRLLVKFIKDYKPHFIYTWNMECFSNTMIYHIHQLGIPILRDISSPWLLRYNSRPGSWIRFWQRKNSKPLTKFIKPFLKYVLPRIAKGLISTEFKPIKSTSTYFTAHWFREKHIQEGVETSKAKVIHTGIVLDDFEYMPPELPALGEKIKFLFLGRIAADKNIEVLIRGLSMLDDDINYQLDILGKAKSEEYLSEIQLIIKKYKQDNNIFIKNYISRNEVPVIMSKYHFLLFPSHQEIFSRLLFESMAVGLPVIAANSGGNLEVIENYVTGYLFDQNNPTSLANIVRKAVTNKQLFIELQRNGRKLVEDKYTINHFLQRVYQEIQLILNNY